MSENKKEDETGDNASAERELFGARREEQTLLVGSALGVTRVAVAAGQVGQFSLEKRCGVEDIAADQSAVVVGTDEAVLLATGEGFESVGFGPAATVGLDDGWLYAASPDGTVSRLKRSTAVDRSEHWERVGEVAGPRRFDGNLLAIDDGIVRVGERLERLGLDAVTDVTRAGPLAATETGLYRDTGGGDGNGEWVQEFEGVATAVIAAGNSAHAIVDGELVERVGSGWQTLEQPDGNEPRLLAYCGGLTAMSDDGTLSLLADPETSKDGQGGWRSQTLGIRNPTALTGVK